MDFLFCWILVPPIFFPFSQRMPIAKITGVVVKLWFRHVLISFLIEDTFGILNGGRGLDIARELVRESDENEGNF